MSVNGGTDDSTSVLELIDQLEELVTGARRVPLSASVFVNEDEALDLIDRARLGLPDEIQRALHTVEDRARILDEADREAEKLLSTAETRAEELLSTAESRAEELIREAGERAAARVREHALTQEAKAHAATIVTEAETLAASIKAEADAYARDVMVRLEEQLARTASTVRKG